MFKNWHQILISKNFAKVTLQYFKSMQIKEIQPMTAIDRAQKLGLTAEHLYREQMSLPARQAIQNVKKKDRSGLKSEQWAIKQYYKTDAMLQLFNCPDDVQRRNIETLSIQQFVQQYEKNSKPVVIKGCTTNWSARKEWTHQNFYHLYKDVKFKVGQDDDGYKIRIPYKYYLEYLLHNKDDSPIYLFESALEEKEETLPIINNYEVPPYFKDDLFKLAGVKKRPPFRWFIMGPQRSGTTVHLDPLMTSAWNSSLQGHKRWVIFDANLPKSIVKGKQFRDKNYEDEAINYFVQILPKIKLKYSKQQLKIVQFIQNPGQTVFVPGGLWHAVINLDDTIAITQNVMTHYCFDKVWRTTRAQRCKFSSYFLQKLKNEDTQLYNRAISLNIEDNYQMGQKYCKQSVSMSFTPSSSSSSSSSSSQFYSSSLSQKNEEGQSKFSKNKVDTKRNSIINSSRACRSLSKGKQKYKVENYSTQKKISTQNDL